MYRCRDAGIHPAPTREQYFVFGRQPIGLHVYLLVSNQLLQNVGLTKADAVHARHTVCQCSLLWPLVLGCSAWMSSSSFLFELGVLWSLVSWALLMSLMSLAICWRFRSWSSGVRFELGETVGKLFSIFQMSTQKFTHNCLDPLS